MMYNMLFFAYQIIKLRLITGLLAIVLSLTLRLITDHKEKGVYVYRKIRYVFYTVCYITPSICCSRETGRAARFHDVNHVHIKKTKL